MTEFAGVDPDQLRTLANRLKSLSDAIGKGAPVIRRNFEKWDGTLGLAVLQRAVHSVAADGRERRGGDEERLNRRRLPS